MFVVQPDVLLGQRFGSRAVFPSGDDPWEVDKVDGGHVAVLDVKNDAPRGAHPVQPALFLPQDFVHLLAHVKMSGDGGHDVGAAYCRVRRRVDHLEGRREGAFRVAEVHVDRESGGDVVSARKERHHGEALEDGALARTFLPDHDHLRRLPALERRSQDVAQRVEVRKHAAQRQDAGDVGARQHEVPVDDHRARGELLADLSPCPGRRPWESPLLQGPEPALDAFPAVDASVACHDRIVEAVDADGAHQIPVGLHVS
mmetsp:Transcript_56173/g.133371  ORF Transcript_56173/g.133371 Transcript_56173/m.133371 type:complete len:257 (+) Transcript_56173:916-1686(+)